MVEESLPKDMQEWAEGLAAQFEAPAPEWGGDTLRDGVGAVPPSIKRESGGPVRLVARCPRHMIYSGPYEAPGEGQ
jgi:hypothetical protein